MITCNLSWFPNWCPCSHPALSTVCSSHSSLPDPVQTYVRSCPSSVQTFLQGKSPRDGDVPKDPHCLPVPMSFSSSPCSTCTSHTASLIFFKHENHPAASGPLHLLFFARLPQVSKCLAPSPPSGFDSNITFSVRPPRPLCVTSRAVSARIARGPAAELAPCSGVHGSTGPV